MTGTRGFSLVEVVIATATLALVGLGVASGVVTGHQSTQTLERGAHLANKALDFQERLLAIPFGSPEDPPATGAELDELLDDDDVLGTISLHKLRAFGPAEFELAGFPVPGRWQVVVDADLNGDGAIDAALEEGRDDLLRIAIFHDGRLVARTARVDIVEVQ